MIQEVSNYQVSSSTKDDTIHKLYFTHYFPENKQDVKATLLIVHGMQEHSGRYAEFARFLANKGYAVVAYDHLGHGKTATSAEEFGYFTANGREQVVIDAENMAAYLELKYPYVPHFILGHSMGSFITRCLLQVAQEKFDGAVIVGTGGKIPGIKFLQLVIRIFHRISPTSRSKFIENTFGKMNNAHFKHEKNHQNTNWLSVNEANRQAFLDDELCGIPFTNNGYKTLIELNVDATKRDWAKAIRRKFPLFFISGADDPIGNFGKGIHQTVNDLKNDGFENVSMKLYPHLRHEILNETEKMLVFEEIEHWMNKILIS